MSSFYKKLLILHGLKNDETAILTGEITLGGTNFSLSTRKEIDFNQKYVGLNLNGELLIFEAKPTFFGQIDFSNCVEAGLFFKDKPLFYGCAQQSQNPTEFFKNYSNKFKELTNFSQNCYNDEAIAQENYYLQEKENFSEENQNYGYAQTETACYRQTEDPKGENETFFNEENSNPFESEENYFSLNQEKIDEIFQRGSEYLPLSNVIPNSKWVKINYSQSNFYVVGIVQSNGQPLYICYGIPGTYNSPPQKLKGVASFVPNSLFNLLDDGFYMLFQCAKTGGKITPKIDIFGL